MTEDLKKLIEACKDADLVEKFMKGQLTTNKHGYMLSIDDPNFTESLALIDKSKPVGDFGVAYGYSSKRLLEEGFTVIANDLDQGMLDHLKTIVTEENQQRLTLVPGNLVEIEFEENLFGAIFALRWMHFLKGNEFRRMMSKFYKWLAPGGVLIVSCGNSFELDNPEFKYVKSDDPEWPGEMCLLPEDTLVHRLLPGFINIISMEVLLREAIKAGFDIYKANLIGRNFSENVYSKPGLGKENYS